ncbi:hypothetical protein [Pseudonocardia sp. ICBG162]|uniref:hypothetical protein n=1 Tax=Pseudonocardia sp. ICBG162 TaxID=2846761 RepID=UPI001CF62417|nr:hypothetical protein [Pseudonocardia sp. ICBG162]
MTPPSPRPAYFVLTATLTNLIRHSEAATAAINGPGTPTSWSSKSATADAAVPT